MKFLPCVIAFLLTFPAMANFTKRDTLEEPQGNRVSELFMIGKKAATGIDNGHRFSPFKGHWSGFNYGFINFAHTDYSMYNPDLGEFMELDWTHSFSLQFNPVKYSVSLVPRNNFGIVCGLGLEYQRMRFESNYMTITDTENKIEPVYLYDNPQISDIKRSTFKILYLTIPLLLEVQFPSASKQKIYVSGGFLGGVRMHSKTKVVYKDPEGDKHKEKNKNSFNLVPFKADVVGRIGYNCVNIWGSYTLTRLFKSGKGPELHPYTLGLGITF